MSSGIIKCKQDFYRLASLGLCGNTPRTWDSVDEYWPYREQYPFVGLRRTINNSKRIFPREHFSNLKRLYFII